jgi:hypothetical protein
MVAPDDRTTGSQWPDRDASRAIEGLLDRLRPPEPSAGLVNRLYAGGAGDARTTRPAPFRPWALAAAAAAAVVAVAYVSTGDLGPVSTTSLSVVATDPDGPIAIEDDTAPAVRLGTVHPIDAAAEDEDGLEDDGDDEDFAFADLPLHEREVPFI